MARRPDDDITDSNGEADDFALSPSSPSRWGEDDAPSTLSSPRRRPDVRIPEPNVPDDGYDNGGDDGYDNGDDNGDDLDDTRPLYGAPAAHSPRSDDWNGGPNEDYGDYDRPDHDTGNYHGDQDDHGDDYQQEYRRNDEPYDDRYYDENQQVYDDQEDYDGQRQNGYYDNQYDGQYDENHYDENHYDDRYPHPNDNFYEGDDGYYDSAGYAHDPHQGGPYHDPPMEMAPDYNETRALAHKQDEERLLQEEQDEARSKRKSRRLWAAILCCLLCIVLLLIGIYLVRRNDDPVRPVPVGNNATRAPTTPRGVDNGTSTTLVRHPTTAPTREDPSAPTPSPIATVPQMATVRVDLMGGTDVLNDASNVTLTDSCQLFLMDYQTNSAIQDIECLVAAQELVERTLPRRLSRWTVRHRQRAAPWGSYRRLQTMPALRVTLETTASVDAAAAGTSAWNDATLAQLFDPRATDDLVTLLLNSRDGAFSSVTDVILSEDDTTNATLAPTLGSDTVVVPAATVAPVNATMAPTAEASSVTILATPAPVPRVTLAPITAFPTISPTVPMDIQTKLEQTIGTDKFDTDVSNPYNKALAWVQESDPLQMTAQTPNLVQRFIAVYVYYATSTTRDWLSCGPMDVSTSDATCTYHKVTEMNPMVTEPVAATKWLSGVGECTWVGIECDVAAQIKAIELAGMNMTGSFPAGLEFLPSLKHVLLTAGELSGTLPADALSRMTSLVNLDVQYNLLTGPIPMGSWSPTLENLYLSNNLLGGSLVDADVARLTNLQGLLVSKNALTGSIPHTLGSLTRLEYLRLNSNRLVGPLPTSIGNLVLLTELDGRDNQLSGTIPSTWNTLVALTDFRLGGNRLVGSIPESIYDLTGLTRLELFSNALTGTLSLRLGQLTALEQLQLYNNTLAGPIPVELNQLTATLKKAYFFANALTGAVPLCTVAHGADVTADCLPDATTSLPELACPCCSVCCDVTGLTCAPNM